MTHPGPNGPYQHRDYGRDRAGSGPSVPGQPGPFPVSPYPPVPPQAPSRGVPPGPPQGPPHGVGGGPYGYPPPYGPYPQRPAPRSKAPLIIGILVGCLAVVGIIFGILFLTGVLGDDHQPNSPSTSGANAGDEPPGEIEDSTLLPLVEQCRDGVMPSCDLLGAIAAPGTEAGKVAATCGGAMPDAETYEAGRCSAAQPPENPQEQMPAPGGSPESSAGGEVDLPAFRGDDPVVDNSLTKETDELRKGCLEGEMLDCDGLWWDSLGVGENGEIAETCGGRREREATTCVGVTP